MVQQLPKHWREIRHPPTVSFAIRFVFLSIHSWCYVSRSCRDILYMYIPFKWTTFMTFLLPRLCKEKHVLIILPFQINVFDIHERFWSRTFLKILAIFIKYLDSCLFEPFWIIVLRKGFKTYFYALKSSSEVCGANFGVS